MKILILEDNNERIHIFTKLLSQYECHFFKNVASAIKYTKHYGMSDILFLDHDLDDRIYVSSEEENTGYQFAKFLANNNYHCKQIFIHSMNPVGVENMLYALKGVTEDLQAIIFPELVEKMK